jgi:hypothetical protein
MTAHEVQVLRGTDALAALPELVDLCVATGCPVTAGPLWWRAAADAAGPAWSPVLVRVLRAGRPVAAAPLSVRRAALGLRLIRSMSHARADHARLPAVDPAAAEALATALARMLARPGPWRLELDQLPEGDPVVAALGRLVALRTQPGTGCPEMLLDRAASLQSALSVNGRKSLRRGRNRLATDGRTAQMRWLRGDQALAALPEVQELRRARDHALSRASEMDDPASRGFHTTVTTGLVAAGQLELLRCEVDGALAAYAVVLLDGPVLRVWDGRVAPGHERYGLGWLADVEVLDRAHRDPSVVRVDWMRGEQESKLRSATGTVRPVSVIATSGPWLDRGERWAQAVHHQALQTARRLVPPERRHAVRAALQRPAR